MMCKRVRVLCGLVGVLAVFELACGLIGCAALSQHVEVAVAQQTSTRDMRMKLNKMLEQTFACGGTELDVSTLKLSVDQMNRLLADVWPCTCGTYAYDISDVELALDDEGGKVETIEFKARPSAQTMRQKVDRARKKAASWCVSNMSDIQRAKAVHDWLVRNCAYDGVAAKSATDKAGKTGERSHAFDEYGALVLGRATCNGYALAYKAVLDSLGIANDLVANNGNGSTANHLWNRVKVKGAWYNVDVTQDDALPDGGYSASVGCDCFMVSDAALHGDEHYENPVSLYRASSAHKVTYDTSSWAMYPLLKRGQAFRFKGCKYEVTKRGACKLVKGATGKTTVTVPTHAVCLGNTLRVTAVAPKAFGACKKLRAVKISRSVRVVGKQAFKGCSKLGKVVVGSDVTTIGPKAFQGCAKLKKVHVKSKLLKAGNLKGCLLKSAVEKVVVRVGGKKADKKYATKYQKVFAKKTCGKNVTVL